MIKRSAGFTLVELMTALTINLILFAGIIAIFISNVNHYQNSISVNRLNQQMQTAMNLMANEIRRAGYWSNAQNDLGSDTNNNPFMANGTDISISGSCILLTYDSNGNGSLPSIASGVDDERYGFRLSGNAIQARPYGAAFDCNAAQNAWENITDTNVIQITALTFTLNTSTVTTGPGNKGIQIRNVTITMTGRLTDDNTVTRTFTQQVQIMNDKLIGV